MLFRSPEITGEKVSYITIRGGTSGSGSQKVRFLGYARTKRVDGYSSPTYAMVVGQIARIAAGSIAEVMAGHPMTAGWSDDLSKIRALAKSAIIKFGFDSRFYGIQIDQQTGNPILSEAKTRQLEDAMSKLIQQGMELAKNTLTTNWSYVILVATELMKKGEIDGQRFTELGKFATQQSQSVPVVTPSIKSLMCMGFYGRK